MIETVGRFELGERKRYRQRINAIGFEGKDHGGCWLQFASVVVKMKHSEADSVEGKDLLNLVLAAPDLLKALEITLSHTSLFNRDGDTVWDFIKQQAETAINKAKGIK
jgi:hypothetical protein